MAETYLSEIRIFGFNYAPYGWAQCAGQVLPISQYSALFALIGTYYGGNGTTNFQLPNFEANVAMSTGQGPGLSDYVLGETAGSPTVTLQTTTTPSHTHGVNADKGTASAASPANSLYKEGERPGQPAANIVTYNTSFTNTTNLNPQTISPAGNAGGAVPHNNIMPIMALNYCIALQGVFPPRT